MTERLDSQKFQRMVNLHNRSVECREGPSGDEYIAIDPYTGVEISPHRPPESLQADSKIGQGYVFLIDHGENIQVDVLLHSHGEAADLDAPGLNFDQRIAGANIVLLEALGWNEQMMQDMNHLSNTGKIRKSLKDDYCANDASYRERLLNAVSKSGAVISFNDIDEGPGIRNEMIELGDFHGDMGMQNMSDRNRKIAREVHIFTFESYREWFMIGQIGYQIQRIIEGSGVEASQLPYVKIVISLGATHTGVVDKLRRFNVRVNEVKPDIKRREIDTYRSSAIKMGRASVGEMERIHFGE